MNMRETIRPRRSALFMPASNARTLEKAKSLGADALVFDLDDAVSPDQKPDARKRACACVAAGGYGNREVVIRVNPLSSAWGADDFAAVAKSGADALCVPKVQSAQDVAAVREALAKNDAPRGLAIWAMIETPLGVLNAAAIAAVSRAETYPLEVLLMGTNDLAKETRAAQTVERLPMLAWLSGCVAAARAYGLDILDGVYNNYRDEEGLRRQSVQGRELGMDGKTLIHPDQIAPCNEIFSPGKEEISWARKIIAAFDEPDNKGKGVLTLEGSMVELMHLEIAKRAVAIAEAIAQTRKPGDDL